MFMKLLVKFTIVAVISITPIAQSRDADRGAGGGGDGLIVLLNDGLINNSFKNSRSIYHRSSLEFYENEFCRAVTRGLGSGISFSTEVSDKAYEVCAGKGKKVVAQHGYLVSAENTRLIAKNYPELSKIELSAYRIEELRSELPSDLFQVVMEIIGVHEVLSLLKIEGSNDYHLSHKIMYLSDVDFSLEAFKKYGLRSMNSLELAVGPMALNYDSTKRYDEFYGGLRPYILRDFLATFSPAFDQEISETIGDDYQLDFQKRKAQRGNRYLVPWSDSLLEPIIKRLGREITRRIDRLEVYLQPSWALAIQLHQVLIATQYFEDLKDYKVLINKKYIPYIGNFLKVSEDKKTIEISIQDNLTKEFQKQKRNIKFSFVNDYDFEQPAKNIANLIQDWVEIDIVQMDAKFSFLSIGAGFEVDSAKPDYLDTKRENPSTIGGDPKRHALGLATYSEILEAIKKQK